jgi:hypothetical protein
VVGLVLGLVLGRVVGLIVGLADGLADGLRVGLGVWVVGVGVVVPAQPDPVTVRLVGAGSLPVHVPWTPNSAVALAASSPL